MSRAVRRTTRGDSGSVLILTLVVVVVLGATVVALARYATANLRYGQVSDSAASHQAAADGALKAALDQIRAGVAPCLYDTATAAIPGSAINTNGITTTVQCTSLDGPIDSPQSWSVVLTAESVSGSRMLATEDGSSTTMLGPVWMSSVGLSTRSEIFDRVDVSGPVVHRSPPCPASASSIASDIGFTTPLVYRPVCVGPQWQSQPSFDDPPLPATLSTLPPGSYEDVVTAAGTCRVFQPGVYLESAISVESAIPIVTGSDAYFASGDYVFHRTSGTGLTLAVQSTREAVAGKPDPSLAITPSVSSGWACWDVYNADMVTTGATFYLSGLTQVRVEDDAFLEIMPRLQSGADNTSSGASNRSAYVSVQSLCRPTHGDWCDGDIPLRGTTLSGNSSIVRVADGGEVRLHGLTYVPLGQVKLDGGADGAFLGGVVAARLEMGDVGAADAIFERPLTPPPAPIELLLTATAAADGVTTRMQANVTYDPAAPVSSRATVSAWHFCEPTGC